MPYAQTRTCPICQRANLKDISAHLRKVHELSSSRRAQYLNSSKIISSRNIEDLFEQNKDDNLNSNAEEPNTMNFVTPSAPSLIQKGNRTGTNAKNVDSKVARRELLTQLYANEPTYRVQPKCFILILQQLQLMNMERAREYIQKRAPEDLIMFFRSLSDNVDKFDLTYDQHFLLKHSRLFKQINNPSVHRSFARKLMARDEFITFMYEILPHVLMCAQQS